MSIEEKFAEVVSEGVGPSGIIWRDEVRRVGDLLEWPDNPRRITDEQAKHLAKSIVLFGYADPILINTDNMIVGGHMRLRVMRVAGMVHDNTKIAVRVPSRPLDPEEFEELAIRLNKNVGTWDFEKLSMSFDQTNLRNWGFSPMEFGMQSQDLKPTKLKPAQQKTCPECGAILP